MGISYELSGIINRNDQCCRGDPSYQNFDFQQSRRWFWSYTVTKMLQGECYDMVQRKRSEELYVRLSIADGRSKKPDVEIKKFISTSRWSDVELTPHQEPLFT